MKASEEARAIRDAVLKDLHGRRGYRQTWDGIDEDIQKEILDEIAKIIDSRMKPQWTRVEDGLPPEPGERILVAFENVPGDVSVINAPKLCDGDEKWWFRRAKIYQWMYVGDLLPPLTQGGLG